MIRFVTFLHYIFLVQCKPNIDQNGEKTDRIQPPKLIPRADIFSPPDFSQLSLSADGRWLSWISYTKNTPNVWLRMLPDGHPFQLTSETGRGVLSVDWAWDNRTLIYSQVWLR